MSESGKEEEVEGIEEEPEEAEEGVSDRSERGFLARTRDKSCIVRGVVNRIVLHCRGTVYTLVHHGEDDTVIVDWGPSVEAEMQHGGKLQE